MAIRKRPFGYEMCRGLIQSCPAEAEVVQMLHEQYANGLSYRQLTAILNAGTISYNEPDKPWNKNMVARILGNDIYIGNKGYPPILEESLLRKVQAMKPDAGQTADTRAKMLRAMCRCASCGRKPAMNANAKGWQRWNCPECGALTSKATLQSVAEDLETILSELRVDSSYIEAKTINGCSKRIADLEQELAEAMEKETFDDIQGRAIAMELASARFEMLGNEEYESYRMGGASSHDVQDGILDPKDPDFMEDLYRLRRRHGMFRVKGWSWWPEELPSEDEYAEARETLERADWKVDYVITHSAPSGIVKKINERYQTDALTDFLEEVREKLKFHYWLFGHYHDNRNIGNNFVLLYEQIVQAI